MRPSYFSLLFDHERRRGSLASSTTSGDATPTLDGHHEPVRERRHRSSTAQSTTLPTTPGLITPGYIYPTENAINSPRNAVGTPDYLAPESILGTGQDATVDWVRPVGSHGKGIEVLNTYAFFVGFGVVGLGRDLL